MNRFKRYKLAQSIALLILAAVMFVCAYQLNLSPFTRSSSLQADILFCCVWLLFVCAFLCIFLDKYFFRKKDNNTEAFESPSGIDPMTGVRTRQGFDEAAKERIAPEAIAGVGCVAFALEDLDEINNRLGYKRGDQLLRDFSEIFSSVASTFGLIGRNAGNEFIVVIRDCERPAIAELLSGLNTRLAQYNSKTSEPIRTIHGVALNYEEKLDSLSRIIALAIRRLGEPDRSGDALAQIRQEEDNG